MKQKSDSRLPLFEDDDPPSPPSPPSRHEKWKLAHVKEVRSWNSGQDGKASKKGDRNSVERHFGGPQRQRALSASMTKSHQACLAFEMTLSATSDPHTVERHKWGAERQLRKEGEEHITKVPLSGNLPLSGMASSSGKRLKTMATKRKEKEPEQPQSSRFLSRKHEKHFRVVQDRRLLMERKVGMIPNFAPQFGEQVLGNLHLL
ncbi:hypothetical protein LR48_Vigan09g076500 [Vigna angularis]|uniref:Uncharacterized protein n=1 Tax=Phaseolus angularis TaxID=3914 RepID=A0A0L9VAL2_PHAAN|nr:hypothetical protein LR48_Vigan09g076500 [Vigna angularis]